MNGLVSRPRNGLSLCAGAGGLDMGLMLAEPDFHTRCFVEFDEYPRRAIIAAQRAGYFAPAPIWNDVKTFDGSRFHGIIDTVLAGYPCQPFSAAGQRKGSDDPRHLWPHVARIITEVDPVWVFLENVSGHISLGLEAVLRELWDMGYTPATGIFSAGETGAPHERQRVFIVAYREGADRGSEQQPQGTWSGRSGPSGSCPELADTSGGSGHQGGTSGRGSCQGAYRQTPDRSGRQCVGLFPPGPGDSVAWTACLAVAPSLAPALSLRDVRRAADHLAEMVEQGELAEAEAQSELCLMADGMATRSRALRLLGNGVFPLAAGYAWRTLSASHGLRPLDLETAGRPRDPAANGSFR